MQIILPLVLIIMVPPVNAGQDWGVGFKIGAQTANHPISGDKSTKTRYEAELASPMFANNHMDLAFTFGGASVASFEDEALVFDNIGWVEDTSKDNISVLDLRLAARFYPLRRDYQDHYHHFRISPYVGAGFGYYWLIDTWETTHTEATEDLNFPGVYYTVTDEDDGTETFSKGFFPFLLAGFNVSVTSQCDLLVELQYDFSKKDDGIDLGGTIVMVGGRIRW